MRQDLEKPEPDKSPDSLKSIYFLDHKTKFESFATGLHKDFSPQLHRHWLKFMACNVNHQAIIDNFSTILRRFCENSNEMIKFSHETSTRAQVSISETSIKSCKRKFFAFITRLRREKLLL